MQKNVQQEQNQSPVTAAVNRREILLGAGAVGAGLMVSTLNSQTLHAAESHAAHTMHHGAEPHPHAALVESAMDCVANGAICLDECIVLLATGNPSMAACIRAVSEMMPACDALARLAALRSPHLKKMAAICIDICEACEKQCKIHADKHWQCRKCMESCQHCIKLCKQLLAAA